MNRASEQRPSLYGVRVLGAITGIELFGHERGNIEVFKTLREAGAVVRVGVNTMHRGGTVGEELRSLGFETFELPFGPQWSLRWLLKHPTLAWRNPLSAVKCSARLRHEAREFRATHIHIGSALAYSYLCVSLFRSTLPLIYRIGDAPPDSRFNMVFWKGAISRATRIVAISRFIRDRAVSAGADFRKIDVVYNLAPTSVAALRADGAATRPDDVRAYDPARPRLLYVGAVAEQKGLMPLVDAVAELRREWPGLTLNIVGESRWDGDFRRLLKTRIGELGLTASVRFAGQVADPRQEYRNADVHVLPSLWDEALSNVVLEAKREAVPSVVFPSGGLPELIRHQVDGLICESKTSASLAGAIGRLLRDPARLHAMGQAARAGFEGPFGPARFAWQWAAVYSATQRAASLRDEGEVVCR